MLNFRDFHVIFKRKLLYNNSKYRLKHSWVQPSGYDTKFSVYNCVATSQVPLVVKNKHLVSWYTCGPTVYDEAHIGHASCYMRLDIIQRVLKKQGLNIVSTMNITDIDDKIITKSTLLKTPVSDLSKEYEKLFWADMDALNVSRPNHILRVSENMPEIIDFVAKLISDEIAYIGKDSSVYFDVEKYEGLTIGNTYGKLTNISKTHQEEQKLTLKFKKNVEDFALWKSAKEGEPQWEAPFGPGRPGWHIECSAMATSFLGNPIDIHAGGIDLRFPHHENEEAQSCAYHHCNQWVNYWLHVGYLHLPLTTKMSKSLKNTVSIQELLKTCHADVFRMVCLLTNYKNNIEFSLEHINLAESHLNTFTNFLNNAETYLKLSETPNINQHLLLGELSKTIEEVDSSLRKDFNTAGCIKSLEILISVCNKHIFEVSGANVNKREGKMAGATLLAVVNYVREITDLFGLFTQTNQLHSLPNESEFSQVMDVFVNFRHQLRNLSLIRKDKEGLELCDDVRNECKKLGINLKDHAKISSWSR